MKYRKKAVVIEAFRWDGPQTPIPDWGRGSTMLFIGADCDSSLQLMIETLEGSMCANPGDWIIRGVAGEIYPCKPEIFAATYEPAE